ncbi:SusC/RagA family TonB-linked outer membrane protein [Flavivirga aquatica]|uniref:SusC/RagA family TonB-linked outer membrane protein n=1 Tax=Flavivirga aquatica TaxID=1849968 RepID=A0A1E5SJI0_9FLAO|nr:SusC/RagA family TonB-linked outer membrane protein [Flavivirga aquatica]OEJ99289.1 SusC/RagA family TonB-linked outer membrane protein [Flavivirga aquatica]
MKTKFSGMLTLFIAFVVQISFAQEKTISGTVIDNSGLPLPGATIIIKDTSSGTSSDFDGKYSISAKQGATLVFSFVGYTTQEVPIGASNTLNVTLTEDAESLEEIVVTAQGIKREKKSLGYAVSTVKQESIQERAEGDIARVLSGKLAGVNITSSNGISGSGTNIIIRGFNSITGSNQPLFVVDGVPFGSDTNNQSSFLDGQGESSRFLDLDPNSIENISVLKGLSATVLYGNKGSNGVILITTKNASSGDLTKKTEVSISQSAFVSNAILPKYQNNYGGGFHQGFGFFFSNWGSRFDRTDDDGIGNALQYTGNDAANGNAILLHPFNFIGDQSLVTGYENLLTQPYEYKAYANNVKDFFRTGYVTSTSINVRGGSENANFNANYGRLEDEGITRGNKLVRNTFSIGGNAKLSNKFSVNGVFNFSRTDFKAPPVSASTGSGAAFDGTSVFGDILYTPRSVDLTNIPFQTVDGRSLYYRSGNDLQNPYWTVENAKVVQVTDRFFSNMGITFALNDWSNISYRLGLDTYTELNSYGQNKGGIDGDPTGLLRTISVRSTIWDNTLSWIANRELSENLKLSINTGINSRRDTFVQDGIESTGQLVFGVLEHFNFTTASSENSFVDTNPALAFKDEQNQLGVFADITLDFKNYLFFNAVARNDWYSTLETKNNSILYPGASVSFIPTAAFDNLKGDALNYLKARAAYGSSASTALPFNTRNKLRISSRDLFDINGNVISSNSVDNNLGNPDLKPERLEEFEIGIDSRFFNRLNFNLSIYQKTTTDVLNDIPLDDATGNDNILFNIGEIQTEGIEIDYDLDIIKSSSQGLALNIAGNFSAYESTVTKLIDGVDNIPLTDFVIGEAANFAVEGRPYGVLLGTTVLRDANGNRIVGNNGRYLLNNQRVEIGDPNPDWTSSLIPTIKYKGFKLSAQLQYRHGGDIYSNTAAALLGRGVVDANTPLCRECNYVLPGVLQNGNPNNIAITATNLQYHTYFADGINEHSIFDGSTIRLQEASLSYSLSKKQLERTPFGNLTFTLSGNNLWFKALHFPDDVNYDTNSASTGVGNGQGIDFISGPSSRRYGFSVKATF